MPTYDEVRRGAKVPITWPDDLTPAERAERRRRYGPLAELPHLDLTQAPPARSRGGGSDRVVYGVHTLAKLVEVFDHGEAQRAASVRDTHGAKLMRKFQEHDRRTREAQATFGSGCGARTGAFPYRPGVPPMPAWVSTHGKVATPVRRHRMVVVWRGGVALLRRVPAAVNAVVGFTAVTGAMLRVVDVVEGHRDRRR